MLLRIALPTLTALLLLPVASATPFCENDAELDLPPMKEACSERPLLPPLPWAAECSSYLLFWTNAAGAGALAYVGDEAGWALRSANHLAFGAPC